MRRGVLSIFIGMAVAVAATAAYGDEKESGAWYVSPMAQWWQLDENRQAANHVAGQVAVGYRFDDEMAVELEGGGASFAAACGCALTLRKVSLDLIQGFLPYRPLHPYVIAGLGAIRDREDRLPKTNALSVDVGAGLYYALSARERIADALSSATWQLRAEIKYQHEFRDLTATNDSVSDIVYGIGVQYSF